MVASRLRKIACQNPKPSTQTPALAKDLDSEPPWHVCAGADGGVPQDACTQLGVGGQGRAHGRRWQGLPEGAAQAQVRTPNAKC